MSLTLAPCIPVTARSAAKHGSRLGPHVRWIANGYIFMWLQSSRAVLDQKGRVLAATRGWDGHLGRCTDGSPR